MHTRTRQEEWVAGKHACGGGGVVQANERLMQERHRQMIA